MTPWSWGAVGTDLSLRCRCSLWSIPEYVLDVVRIVDQHPAISPWMMKALSCYFVNGDWPLV